MIEQQQEMYKLMGYGFVVLVILILFLQFYFARGKKTAKMGNKKYFNTVVLRELNKYALDNNPLKIYTSVSWRNSINTKFHNYYLGLTNEKLILIKVKSYLGSFTDTNKNTALVNHSYNSIKELSITDDNITEQKDNIYTSYDIKLIKFRVDNKQIELKLKYEDIFGEEIPTIKIINILEEKCNISY